jgi:hypothetical protein
MLLGGDPHLLVQLGDVTKTNLGAFARSTRGDRAGERVHVAPSAVVDDGDSGRMLRQLDRVDGISPIRNRHLARASQTG